MAGLGSSQSLWLTGCEDFLDPNNMSSTCSGRHRHTNADIITWVALTLPKSTACSGPYLHDSMLISSNVLPEDSPCSPHVSGPYLYASILIPSHVLPRPSPCARHVQGPYLYTNMLISVFRSFWYTGSIDENRSFLHRRSEHQSHPQHKKHHPDC